MESRIREAIEAEARRRIGRYSKRAYHTKKHRRSFSKRTGLAAGLKPTTTPPIWDIHPHFDPRYCINRSRFIAQGCWKSLLAGAYVPKPAVRIVINKPAGGTRNIDIFSVVDAAISQFFFSKLRARNGKIFSDASYAYQEGKTPLDAVVKLRQFIFGAKLFVSQFDFSKYFDSIAHNYLNRVLSENGLFLTTHMERALLVSIMTHEFATADDYAKKSFSRRSRGIPQGNSLSLFLANAAAHELDLALDRLSGSFARFADDSVVINSSYEDAIKSSSAFHDFAQKCGVALNEEKSQGIKLLSKSTAEIGSIPYFDFLSYRFQQNGLGMSARAQQSIKRRCVKILYNHLLLHQKRTKKINSSRIGAGYHDWDLVTCINELRHYIYGGMSEKTLDEYLSGTLNVRLVKGASSYFCLLESGDVFRELDGWLKDILSRTYASRIKLAASLGLTIPHLTEEELTDGTWYTHALAMETKLPSFYQAWRAARKSWKRHGIGGVLASRSGYSYP